jgi:NAD(P) transhydrogenase subunit beta
MVTLTNFSYLIATILFIFGLKGLSSPKTARRGNFLAMLAMLIAVLVTLFDRQILDFTYIIIGLITGAAIGAIAARRVQMTAMPQMVAIFNGFGGGASALVAYSEYLRIGGGPRSFIAITVVLSLLIGTVTFTGSLVAFSKLQGLMRGSPVVFPLQRFVNALLLVAILVLGAAGLFNPSLSAFLLAIVILSAVLGILSVIPIGGADMPVVISLLNACSGLAAAATGFVLSNNILIISGSLVGAAGLVLTQIMCKAMNRSLKNVLFGAVGGKGEEAVISAGRREVTEYTSADAAMMLKSAQSVIIVPGYGFAVAQAQHVLHELASILIEEGLNVRYAIHPVAGRMPGHMNVLLAEANVPYDFLCDMDKINDDFQNTDVALVVGANDVINPAARHNKKSSLYGMPILNADKAKSIIICKRSLRPGFSGEDNELFYDRKTMMLFGDAKETVAEILKILKS